MSATSDSPGTGNVILDASQVTKAFGGLVAVSQVDFRVERNEIVALIGPNGAGKTTLFNAITGVYPPTSGKIWFRGHDIAGLLPSKVTRLGIARTFQNIRLFNEMTALENVMVGQHCRTSANVLRIIAQDPRGRARGEGRPRQEPSACWTTWGSGACSRNWQRTCPTGRSAGSRSPARWPRSPNCCSWTNRRPA